MKIAITGKGGVGKTTLSAILSHLFSETGKRVIAVDADPDANLGAALGIGMEDSEKIRPIAEMTDLIAERTGARPGSSGGVFRLNPRVDDIPEDFGYKLGNIIMLIMGRSKEAASGCYCPENVFLRRLLGHLIIESNDVVIVDMEAGIEHLTRGTSSAVDVFIIVVEPGQRSIQTAHTVRKMAEGLGIKKLFIVANKVRGMEDTEFIKNMLKGMSFLGAISFSDCIMEADIRGDSPFQRCPDTVKEVKEMKKIMERELVK
ncbi:septum site-determining protein MinD [bacterium BMS3Abin07]|nr:septum site-determining protein MinD [bacterium BMS3Abin07]GBE33473.1 septum site-determining protein MinD [bacterium BMS3Bbin05]HDL20208.1 carbon monoxide dehydrogenase [Nitrospirota bacterium]HDO23235.1 carbon monoxide dehydrogenase [Nitrospirota bacterium]HDZ88013.1 carbon monoxide dehydrogenase [Nitrospirota bacterium]